MRISCVRGLPSSLLFGVALAAAAPAVVALPPTAQAQAARVSLEFRTALEPYGHWVSHARWREVWVPDRRPRDWRPYTKGHWIYTDEWGWYWIPDGDEEDFGWLTYHYGRWVFDRDLGWVWVPGDEWAPAWVDWRRGNDYVGWAPSPPDELAMEYRDDPRYWIFVRPSDVVAPRLTAVILPPRQQTVYFQSTVVVNRTVVIDNRGPRIAVNPGIPPAYIAAAAHRPVNAFTVQPRVLAGTRGVQGAVEIRANEIRARSPRQRGGASAPTNPVVQKTSAVIQPAATVPSPQPLKAQEKGRLGPNPPKAAQGATQPTGTAPSGALPAQEQPSAPAKSLPGSQQPPRPEGKQMPAQQSPPPPVTSAPGASPPPSKGSRPSQIGPSGPPTVQEKREEKREAPTAPKRGGEQRVPSAPPPAPTTRERREPSAERPATPEPRRETHPPSTGAPPAEIRTPTAPRVERPAGPPAREKQLAPRPAPSAPPPKAASPSVKSVPEKKEEKKE